MATTKVTFKALYEAAETTVKTANASIVERSTRRKLQAGIDDCARQVDELDLANLEELKKLNNADFNTIASNRVQIAELKKVQAELEQLEKDLFEDASASTTSK